MKGTLSNMADLLLGLFPGVMAAQNVPSAQVSVDYDAEDDGLIEGEWLDQLDTVRWGLNGYGQ